MVKQIHFRKPRLLIVGCGDVLARALPWLQRRFRIYATARSDESAQRLRGLGVIPVRADLDQRHSLRRLGGLAQWLIHSTPPATQGQRDPRTHRLIAALSGQAAILAQPAKRPARNGGRSTGRAVYIGTSGVYGNCNGDWVDETRPLAPDSPRAQRRADAEASLRGWARRQQVQLALLRAPGIYAADRLPTARLQRGEAAIAAAEDSYSNHIHADDLAKAVCMALFHGRPLRSYNACDDEPHKMGDWFDMVADHVQLPRSPRVSRAEAQQLISPGLLSYLNESRRIRNDRLKYELRVRLQWPTAADWLAAQTNNAT
ncbi:Nucleoside-diphosphate-sugar epimerase [Andreprevotia lacus DSM 23236]|uniref:Nucleoside-diphosphate-sugar epimerase n=1 Tax=Andreprevotia lacus DSM 23236 TaxID=1121001 RepID=A0A1W1XK79_9NEIS|nr:NAD-dependent epimerase/dehydratase family protein [Andreprevotia lacus]SMC24335.1 Nucleoside-diphosphate-sugar epimerase [Andreprevotia lacus DSM 23236]